MNTINIPELQSDESQNKVKNLVVIAGRFSNIQSLAITAANSISKVQSEFYSSIITQEQMQTLEKARVIMHLISSKHNESNAVDYFNQLQKEQQ